MISINDYDTGFNMDSTAIGKLRSKCIILIDQLNSVPIFFVKEETMDNHNSTTCLRRDCTKEFLMTYEREIENRKWAREENVVGTMKRMEHCLGKCNAVGCYIQDADDISDKPHILICPERINHRNKNQFQDLLLEIIIHELTHAYFSTGSELNDLSKHIIEESLCEAYAFSKFENTEQLFEFISDPKRPPEYTAFKFWIEISRNVPLILLMNEWKNKRYDMFTFGIFPFPYERFFTHSRSLEQIALLVLSFS